MSAKIPPLSKDSEAIPILATEHGSLLASSALTYKESLGRVNMFLAILSGAVIALRVSAHACQLGPVVIAVAFCVLAVVFFVVVATVGRLLMLNRDDYCWVLAMNRLRHGYLAMHPELEPNFSSSPYDDVHGALQTLGIEPNVRLGSLFHGFVTLPGMLAVIVAAIGGSIGGLAAAGFGAPPAVVLLAGAAVFAGVEALMAIWNRQGVRRPDPNLRARFPSKPKSPTSSS